PRARKLSYKEQRELEQLPARIEQLENELADVQNETVAADFYQRDAATIKNTLSQLEALQQKLEQAYARWEELEGSG
ncbi:MAG: ABC transporter ATP-binding protein, partial [Candidatus Competibacteraceae bacterium]|nr:ABC transporter ATP-binding protein [Candidatus Competibacteraceae bacterium]